MFQFAYEKFIAFIIPLVVFVSIFGVIIYAFYTIISVPNPEKAPFVQDIREEAAKSNSPHQVTLERPHFSDNEMKNWISKAVSESLSFNKDNYSDIVKDIRPYFTDKGFEKFQDYLIISGIAESIRTHKYDMSVYIERPPLFLNSSVINNTYKWLYQMPVVVSFFPTGQKTDARDVSKFINRTVTLRLQLTRVRVGDDPEAIQIEDWIAVGAR